MKKAIHVPWSETLEKIRKGDSPENARLAALCRAGLLKSDSDTVILVKQAA